MEFEKISLKHKERAEACLCETPYGISESCFVSLFLWGEVYHTEVAFQDGLLFVRVGEDGCFRYMMPMGNGDLSHGLSLILDDAKKMGCIPRLIAVTDEMRERLESVCPDTFSYEEARDSFDYIYDPKELATLSGKKFHQKKGHVNRFRKEYGDRFCYERITRENLADVIAFQEKWLLQNIDRAESLKAEQKMLRSLFANYFTLGVIGGLLRVDGSVVAYSVGTRLCRETMLIQVEKGDIAYHGVYQMINQQFVEHNCADVTYLNREDDAGVEGLRKAKLSYQPIFLMRKYVARWKQ